MNCLQMQQHLMNIGKGGYYEKTEKVMEEVCYKNKSIDRKNQRSVI